MNEEKVESALELEDAQLERFRQHRQLSAAGWRDDPCTQYTGEDAYCTHCGWSPEAHRQRAELGPEGFARWNEEQCAASKAKHLAATGYL